MAEPEAPICPACKMPMALMLASATPSEWPVRYWYCETEECEARYDKEAYDGPPPLDEKTIQAIQKRYPGHVGGGGQS